MISILYIILADTLLLIIVMILKPFLLIMNVRTTHISDKTLHVSGISSVTMSLHKIKKSISLNYQPMTMLTVNAKSISDRLELEDWLRSCDVSFE